MRPSLIPFSLSLLFTSLPQLSPILSIAQYFLFVSYATYLLILPSLMRLPYYVFRFHSSLLFSSLSFLSFPRKKVESQAIEGKIMASPAHKSFNLLNAPHPQQMASSLAPSLLSSLSFLSFLFLLPLPSLLPTSTFSVFSIPCLFTCQSSSLS